MPVRSLPGSQAAAAERALVQADASDSTMEITQSVLSAVGSEIIERRVITVLRTSPLTAEACL